jgi:hypothetical protein
MFWLFITLTVIVLIVGYTLLLNMDPTHCPLCKHWNVFRRRKTGLRREVLADDDVVRQSSEEYVCDSCKGRYWIVWNDFEGRKTLTE